MACRIKTTLWFKAKNAKWKHLAFPHAYFCGNTVHLHVEAIGNYCECQYLGCLFWGRTCKKKLWIDHYNVCFMCVAAVLFCWRRPSFLEKDKEICRVSTNLHGVDLSVGQRSGWALKAHRVMRVRRTEWWGAPNVANDSVRHYRRTEWWLCVCTNVAPNHGFTEWWTVPNGIVFAVWWHCKDTANNRYDLVRTCLY